MEKCKECGEQLFGRIDKKFCNEGCRNAFHNRKSRENYLSLRKVDAVLKKNYKLLKELHDNKIVQLSKERLVQMGFNFSYHTSSRKVPELGKCYYCYDFAYFCSKREVVIISLIN